MKQHKSNKAILISILLSAVGISAVMLLFFNGQDKKQAGVENVIMESMPAETEVKEKQQERELSEEEKDQKFLEEHVYGQWKIAERIYEVKEPDILHCGHFYNFSVQGVEALQQCVLSYGKDYINWADGGNKGIGPGSFTDTRDLFLCAEYDGTVPVREPQYHINYDVDENHVTFNRQKMTAPLTEAESLVEVRYDFGYDRNGNSSVMGGALGKHCYVDPEDTDSLYLDFCGLWRMERNTTEYGVEKLSDAQQRISEYIDFKETETGGSERQEENWRIELPPEEEQFLTDHVYGQWKFTELLYPLDESGEENVSGRADNFSVQGVEALKECVMTYNWDYVGWAGNSDMGAGPNTFEDCRDLYLYFEYGGYTTVLWPKYRIHNGVDDGVDEEHLELTQLHQKESTKAAFTEADNLIEINYDLGYDVNNNSSVVSLYLGRHFYVNPEDTDTLYLDFCGLWKMKRDTNNYRP